MRHSGCYSGLQDVLWQSSILLEAAINGSAYLNMPNYISFRLKIGHVDTDIKAKTGNGTAYHLDINQKLIGGRTISITSVQDPLDTFGQGVHAFQDSYAHIGGLTGHGWRRMPDPELETGRRRYSCPLNSRPQTSGQREFIL